MKTLDCYRLLYNKAFFEFLKNRNVDSLIFKLKNIEKKLNLKNKDIWFKFFKNDTLITTVNDLKNDLSLPTNHSNYQYMIEKIQIGLNDNSIKMYHQKKNNIIRGLFV